MNGPYPTEFLGGHSQPNPNMLSTLILWFTSFYTTIGLYHTLHDFLVITPKDIFHWEYYLAYMQKLNIFQATVLPAPLYEWTN